MKCSLLLINWTLKTKTYIRKKNKRSKANHCSERHNLFKIKCRDFLRVINEKSYFTLTNSKINGNGHFYTSNVELTQNEVKFKTKGKFDVKLLVYPTWDLTPTYNAIWDRNKWRYVHGRNGDTIKYSIYILTRPNIKFVPKSENPPNARQKFVISKIFGV